MGQQLISLKGDRWRGKTTLAVNDRGQRRLLKLENGYVSADGSEIRHFPGYQTLVDLSEDNNDNGYHRYITDGVKPVFESSPSEAYKFLSFRESGRAPYYMVARAKPTHLHGFEQVGNTLVVWGESRFREAPIKSDTGVVLTLSSVAISGGRWTLTMSGTIGSWSLPWTGADDDIGYNALATNSVLYCEGITVADQTLQAAIDANLNNLIHEVKAISGATITLHTTTASTGSASVTAGDVHKVRYNRSNTYSTPNGVGPYSDDIRNRPDDPDALTSWRVITPLGDDITPECYPAWVANRTRDFGDGAETTTYRDAEGVFTQDDRRRGVSRRETRKLPFRTNPDCAQDRIVLAAPGYGCMFQIPLKVPINPQNWPNTPDIDAYGLWYQANDIYDKPRALGIPKARMIESIYTPALESPNQDPATGFNFAAVPSAFGSPEFGFAAGEYLVSIAFEDEALGEEGLASEPVSVTIPSNDYTYTIGINYNHPGYIMPECLASKVNVYIAGPGETAMSYYCSFPLGANPYLDASIQGVNYDESGRYGFRPCSPSNPYALWREYRLKMIDGGASLAEVVDPERQAPQSASMPRGAEACRYIRGVLLAGGATGNTGGSLELWAGLATVAYSDSIFNDRDGMTLITRPVDSAAVPTTGIDGAANEGTLGTAGRFFPDAYQGIEVIGADLFPTGSVNQRVDRVVNHKSADPDAVGVQHQHFDFLRLANDVWGASRVSGASPSIASTTRANRLAWYRMPKGQLQVGDPGAPHRSSKAAIQFIDPNRGDDITAIGNLAGNAIVCSRRETYSMSWYRVPGGEVPQLLSNEHGCIGANTMVEFDGGVAWIGEKGPVAMGGTLQYIGADVQEDFTGVLTRYVADTRGMMRHSWGCHDSVRGLVMWGMLTNQSTHTVTEENVAYAWNTADDELLSRFPCDEVLIWSYRANAFSTWRPPSGLEILWMREIRDGEGRTFVAFLAADGRIYKLDDASNDVTSYTYSSFASTLSDREFTATAAGSASTSLTLSISNPGKDGAAATGRATGQHLKAGMLVELLDDNGEIGGETTIASVGTLTTTTAAITLSAALTWKQGATFRVGARQRMTIIGTYIGAETMDTISVQGTQMRYTLFGTGSAHAKLTYLKTDYDRLNSTSASTVTATMSKWKKLGESDASLQTDPIYRIGRRLKFNEGGVDAPEVTVKVEISGVTQARISDIALEVA